MLVLYIVGGLLALCLLLLCVPVWFRVAYREELTAYVRVCGIRFWLYPAPEKPDKQPTEHKRGKRAKAPPKEKSSPWSELSASLKQNGVSAAVEWLGSVARLLSKAIGRTNRAVTVNRFYLRLDIASEDAAATALTYGKTCAVLYPTLGVLDSLLRIRRQEVTVTPAFLNEENRVQMEINGRVSPVRVVRAAVAAFFSFLLSIPGVDNSRNKDNTKEAVNNG